MIHNNHLSKLRKKFPPHDVRRIFVTRLDEEMFRDIGASHVPKETRQHLETDRPHVLVWIGYEILLGIDK